MRIKTGLALIVLVSALLLLFFLNYPANKNGGDILEYFGMTQTIVDHGGIDLTSDDISNIKQYLDPGYFATPDTPSQNGWYIQGRDAVYPVHFPFYSMLNVPVRLFLSLVGQNPVNTFRVANVLLLGLAAFFLLRNYHKHDIKHLLLPLTIYLSPLLSFLIWPGPDIFYLSCLLVSCYLFFSKKLIPATLFATLASWHSQPVLIISLAFLAYYFFGEFKKHKSARLNTIFTSGLLLILMALPYILNYALFGVATPWTILKDGWTLINGFGIQNASLQKLFEQFFDLNFGLFFYAPVLLLFGMFTMIKNARKNRQWLFLAITLLITCFFYQTNPAWHYGTAGFGPSRHIVFLVPFLIYAFAENIELKRLSHRVILFLFLISQLFVLNINGFAAPVLENSLVNSPFATFVLNNWPALYNPTPEIFVDRTNHTDLRYPSSAIYKYNGVCKKAYILKQDVSLIKKECGTIPPDAARKLQDDFSLESNFSRKVKTLGATFYPDQNACSANNGEQGQYTCLKTREDAAVALGVDQNRLKNIGIDGGWQVLTGEPVELTVPPGYTLTYYSFEGAYVTY